MSLKNSDRKVSLYDRFLYTRPTPNASQKDAIVSDNFGNSDVVGGLPSHSESEYLQHEGSCGRLYTASNWTLHNDQEAARGNEVLCDNPSSFVPISGSECGPGRVRDASEMLPEKGTRVLPPLPLSYTKEIHINPRENGECRFSNQREESDCSAATLRKTGILCGPQTSDEMFMVLSDNEFTSDSQSKNPPTIGATRRVGEQIPTVLGSAHELTGYAVLEPKTPRPRVFRPLKSVESDGHSYETSHYGAFKKDFCSLQLPPLKTIEIICNANPVSQFTKACPPVVSLRSSAVTSTPEVSQPIRSDKLRRLPASNACAIESYTPSMPRAYLASPLSTSTRCSSQSSNSFKVDPFCSRALQIRDALSKAGSFLQPAVVAKENQKCGKQRGVLSLKSSAELSATLSCTSSLSKHHLGAPEARNIKPLPEKRFVEESKGQALPDRACGRDADAPCVVPVKRVSTGGRGQAEKHMNSSAELVRAASVLTSRNISLKSCILEESNFEVTNEIKRTSSTPWCKKEEDSFDDKGGKENIGVYGWISDNSSGDDTSPHGAFRSGSVFKRKRASEDRAVRSASIHRHYKRRVPKNRTISSRNDDNNLHSSFVGRNGHPHSQGKEKSFCWNKRTFLVEEMSTPCSKIQNANLGLPSSIKEIKEVASFVCQPTTTEKLKTKVDNDVHMEYFKLGPSSDKIFRKRTNSQPLLARCGTAEHLEAIESRPQPHTICGTVNERFKGNDDRDVVRGLRHSTDIVELDTNLNETRDGPRAKRNVCICVPSILKQELRVPNNGCCVRCYECQDSSLSMATERSKVTDILNPARERPRSWVYSGCSGSRGPERRAETRIVDGKRERAQSIAPNIKSTKLPRNSLGPSIEEGRPGSSCCSPGGATNCCVETSGPIRVHGLHSKRIRPRYCEAVEASREYWHSDDEDCFPESGGLPSLSSSYSASSTFSTVSTAVSSSSLKKNKGSTCQGHARTKWKPPKKSRHVLPNELNVDCNNKAKEGDCMSLQSRAELEYPSNGKSLCSSVAGDPSVCDSFAPDNTGIVLQLLQKVAATANEKRTETKEDAWKRPLCSGWLCFLRSFRCPCLEASESRHYWTQIAVWATLGLLLLASLIAIVAASVIDRQSVKPVSRTVPYDSLFDLSVLDEDLSRGYFLSPHVSP